MSVTELINQKISSLPATKQEEVLDFVEFLLQKTDSKPDFELEDWNKLSLNMAMQDLENDNLPEYYLSDLKERW